jgi:cytochrome c5
LSLERDQKFFDMYTLTIGGLVLFAIAIFILAMKMSASTQSVYVAQTEEYQQQIASRLRPLGSVYLPGEEGASASPQVAEMASVAPVETTLSGPQVYNEACIACHGAGIGGAPMLTDATNWAPRVAQGMETLRTHAVEGYTGNAGYMPPKGGRLDLSDEEIYAAIDYMISQVPES